MNKKKRKNLLICTLFVISLLMSDIMAFAGNTETDINSAETNAAETDADTTEDNAEETSTKWPAGPEVVAEAAIVMETSTGTILYEKNIDEQLYPASITKVMTALLAVENCEMDEIVTVSHDAVYMEDKGTHIALDEGEELTVEQCLYAVMLASANDAAYALAEHVGGTIEDFIEMMNKKADELGCENTNFTNPHGLPDEEHLTTAYDMALITREALKYDKFKEISGAEFYEIPASEKQKDQIPMYNHHKMLRNGDNHYDDAFAGKTGYTIAAQHTLVTCANEQEMEVVCVILKTVKTDLYTDTEKLLTFAKENFRKETISSQEKNYDKILVDETLNLSGDSVQINTKMNEADEVVLPKDVNFIDLQSELMGFDGTTSENLKSITVGYSYEGHSVGAATLDVVEVKQLKETKEESDIKSEAKKTFQFQWWYILIGVFVVAVIAGVVFWVLFRKQRR